MSNLSAANANQERQPLSLSEVSQAMAAGTVNSEYLVNAALAAIEQGAELNAFITVDWEGVLEQAKRCDDLLSQGRPLGPLHGIPIAVKDNIHVAGLANTAGTLALRNFVPTQDAGVIARLKAAGAIVLGKNNMHELAYGITSDNYAFGAVGNSHNADYIAGGSSGGTAVAVATGMAVAGLGSDTGGSSRIPAALNGLAGFRPTIGRYPDTGLTRISNTRDTVGPIAHNVSDIVLLDSILSGQRPAGEPAKLSGLRLGVPRDYFYENLEPVVAERTAILLRQLQQAGVELVEADLGQVAALNEKIGFPLVIYETAQLLTAYIEENLPGQTLQTFVDQVASPDVKGVLAMVMAGDISESVYRDALDKYRPRLQQLYRDYFAKHAVEAVIFPTTPLSARPIKGSLETVELNGAQVPTFPTYIRNTDPSSNAGIPGLTIPFALSDQGLPLGIEIDGPEATDQRLLAIGLAIEALIQQNRWQSTAVGNIDNIGNNDNNN